MGAGGKIQKSITQTVSFFNTTGLIEKGKGIYFCPLIPSQDKEPLNPLNPPKNLINLYWIQWFYSWVSKPSEYMNILISSWSPQDRDLVVQGNIDDFRANSELGKCFTYCIVERTVTFADNPDTIEKQFYGFFITDAKQTGGASIRVSVEPDDFTNVFFLHHGENRPEHEDYDPFNASMENCYVERQHYDRIKFEPIADITKTIYITEGEFTININNLVNGKAKEYIFDSVSFDSHTPTIDSIYRDANNLWVNGHIEEEIDTSVTATIKLKHIEEANLEVFSQSDENFKYRRQFRDMKKPLVTSRVTEAQKQELKNAHSWNSISATTKEAVRKECCYFLTVILKDNKPLIARAPALEQPDVLPADTTIKRPIEYLPKSTIEDKLVRICVPICILPDWIKEDENLTYVGTAVTVEYMHLKVYSTLISSPVYFGFLNIEKLMNSPTWMSYFVTAFITKENHLLKYMSFENDVRVNLTLYAMSQLGDNIQLALYSPLSEQYDYDDRDIPHIVSGHLVWNYTVSDNVASYIFGARLGDSDDPLGQDALALAEKISTNSDWGLLFVVQSYRDTGSLDLTDQPTFSVKESYYEPILSFNPYSFYSVSYLGNIEVPLNKQSYYQNPVIEYEIIVTTTDALKYTFIPTYEINGQKFKYYTESLQNTIANQLTIVSDRLVEYLIANSAQMKNQYAVNELNMETGLLSGTVDAVGGGIAKGGLGTIGGIAGAVKSLISLPFENAKTERNQKAKMADVGNLPSNLKQTGSDIYSDLLIDEVGLYLNHYTIDELSYNSISKYLERFGYSVNLLVENINAFTRKGWDFVKIQSFDFKNKITNAQEENIRQIFANGVTLLHDKSMLSGGNHNIENIWKGVA